MTAARVQDASAQVKRRRAVGYLVLSSVLPGSVQLFTGARGVGRLALRCWGALWGILILIGLGLWLWRGPTIALLLHPVFLFLARVVVWVVAIGWISLLFDSWRRAEPMAQPRRTRLIMTITTALLTIAMIAVSAFASKTLGAMGDVGSIFLGTGESKEQAGRYNVLLLGADSGESMKDRRPDSIIVASVDAKSGRTVLFSLPRNLEGAPFPKTNPLYQLYPNGYDCPKSECMLNGINVLAHEHKDLFPGVADPGVQSMQDVVGNILGLRINYYAMVDMAGFKQLIDAVGGIRLDINRRIIKGTTYRIYGHIEPGKNVLLNGEDALWFARSRAESDDYDRMARQKCVLNAMAKQLDPLTVATRFSELAAASKGVMTTSVPTGDISKLVDLALAARSLPVASVSFAPPLIHPGRPDFDFIRKEVAASIAKSEALDKAQASTPSAIPAPTTTAPTSTAEATTDPQPSAPPTVSREADDLSTVCSVPD